MNERPPNEDDDVDELYRRASARDASRPSESVRRAVVRRAAELAAQRAAHGGPTQSAPDQNALGPRPSGELGPVKLDFKQPAANEWRWRPAAYGGLAAAALAGLLIAPHFLPPSPAPASSSPEPVLSASKKTEAAPTAPMEALQAPPAAVSPAAPLSTAQGVPAPAMPVIPMRARTPIPDAAPAPRADVPAGTSSVSSAASDAAAAGAARANAAAGAASALEPRAKAAEALAAKPRAFADEASPNEQQGLIGGVSRDRLQSAPAAPPAQPIGSGAVNAFAAIRPQAAIDSATALRQAARGGDTSKLKALLDGQIDVDARDPAGRTALMLAVIGGQAQAVDALLARGADPNAADSAGTTPLAAALAGNHADIAAALRRAGAH